MTNRWNTFLKIMHFRLKEILACRNITGLWFQNCLLNFAFRLSLVTFDKVFLLFLAKMSLRRIFVWATY